MSADFWAGYTSGAIGIFVGNPLDLIKTRIQAGPNALSSYQNGLQLSNLIRGTAAPILGYGALNALLFITYNRSLALLTTGDINVWPEDPSAGKIWTAGALGGLAIWLVSAPTELIKCRAQVSNPPRSSWEVTRELWKYGQLRGLYLGGGITSVRDSVGYGFYFWSYHLSKKAVCREDDSQHEQALKILSCGGLAGVVTWASIFPLDVVKTRVQTWDLIPNGQSLPRSEHSTLAENPIADRPRTLSIARQAYIAEGAGVFFRGLGICSARAFFVNAVQWAVYEWMMSLLAK